LDSSSRVWRIDLRLSPSRFLLILTVLLHMAAAAAVLSSGLPYGLKGFLLSVLLLSGGLSCRDGRRRGRALLRERGTDWWLETAGHAGAVELVQARIWRYLVVMDFRGDLDGRVWRQRLVVFPDAVGEDDFRRLRVSLRYRMGLRQSV
jgi:predicted cobalt transporter CbtA